MKKYNRTAGFTLVEVLVACLIFSVIIGATFALLRIGDISWHFDMGLLDINQHLRHGMDVMMRELRQADDGSVVIDVGGDEIEFAIDGADVSYYLQDSNLVRENPSGTIRVVAQNISSLQFAQTGSVVQIDLTGSKTVSRKDFSNTISEKVRLRNDS
jgi:prepilin-type N-terminal cleavage/methylation domain-containing protein